MENQNTNKEISKIKVSNEVYNVKDSELREIIEILFENSPKKDDTTSITKA